MTIELSRILPGRLLQWGNISCVSEPGKKMRCALLWAICNRFPICSKVESIPTKSLPYHSPSSIGRVQRSKHTLFWLLSACQIWISRTIVQTTQIRFHVRYAQQFTLTLIRSKVKSKVSRSPVALTRWKTFSRISTICRTLESLEVLLKRPEHLRARYTLKHTRTCWTGLLVELISSKRMRDIFEWVT